MNASLPKPLASSRMRLAFVIALLVAGLIGTAALFVLLRSTAEDRERSAFERLASLREAEVQRRIDSMMEVVHSVAAYYESSENVERAEFHEFVRDMLKRHPMIESLQWLPSVPSSEYEAFARRAKAEGIVFVPPVGGGDVHFPILHFEPREKGEPLLGVDQSEKPAMRNAMLRSKKGDGPSTTDWQFLERIGGDDVERLAAMILIPVRGRMDTNRAVEGYAVGVFRIAPLLSDVRWSSERDPMDLYLCEGGEMDALPVLAYRSGRPTLLDKLPGLHAADMWRGALSVGDRRWTLIAVSTGPMRASASQLFSYLVLGGGLLITAALVVHQMRLTRRDRLIEQKVEERTRELAATERFLDSIVENIPDMVFVKDASDLKYRRMNRAWEETMGMNRDELLGLDDGHSFKPEEVKGFHEADRAAIESGEMQDIPEETITTRRGVRILHTKKIPIHDENGRAKYLLGISEDITARKEAEQALADQARELARSNAELEQFAYVASHDLQEPLRMVASYTSLLRKRYGDQLDEKAQQFMGFAIDGAHRMQRLITDLLTLSRIGSQPRAFKPVDLNRVMEVALENLGVAIEDAKATVTNPKLPVVLGEESQLVQLFQNLLGNAIKFHGAESPEVRVSARREGRDQEIAIRDNGIGMRPEFHDRIFTIFQRLHTREEYTGTGIGLALCRKIVERHNGSIRVESTPGEGTTMIFTLRTAENSQ